MSKTDIQLKHDVEEELRWDPKVNSAQIGVSVDDGAVALLGEVDTYAERWAAEDAAKRVNGVRTLRQDLAVKLLSNHVRTDQEMTAAVDAALAWDVWVPKGITGKAANGNVTLEGHASWNYQREAAERAVRHLTGVVDVHDLITLETKTSAEQVREKIEAALQRQATSDARSINITAAGGKVTLTGHASSWQSIEDASSAAWAVPGVTEVVDQVKMAMQTL